MINPIPPTPEPVNGGNPLQNAPDNVIGRDKVLFDLAVEAAQNGNLPMADYLTDRAIDAEKSGGVTTAYLPGFESRVGAMRSLDSQFWKSAARNSIKTKPTPHRYNETLDLLGFYDGLKSFEDVTGHTLRFLESLQRNPVISLIIRRRIYQATRFCNVFNALTNDNRESGTPGYRVKMRESNASVTPAGRKKIAQLQDVVKHGGHHRDFDRRLRRHSITGEPGVWDGFEEEKARPFDELLSILVRQSLGLDFTPLRKESGVDAQRYPVAFFAPVDATRIQRTVPGVYRPEVDKSLKSVSFVEMSPTGDGRVLREFDWRSMDVLLRYPRVDFWGRGYGYCELEDLMDVLAILVMDLRFKRSYLDDNYIPNMLVTMSGQPMNMSMQTIDLMKSQMQNQSGSNHWNKMIFLPFPANQKDPIQTYPLREMAGGAGEISALQQTNMEMVTLACGMYGMHPEEIGYSGVTTMRQQMSEADPQSRLEYANETGFVPLMEKIGAFIDRFIIEQADPDFEFEFVNLEPKAANDPQHVQMLMEQGLSYNRINDLRDMPRENLPLEPDMYRDAEKKVNPEIFDTDEEYRDAVALRYEKECKKIGLTPYSIVNDMPVGNPQSMQVILQEKQQNDGIKLQAKAAAGDPVAIQQLQQQQIMQGGMPGQAPGQSGQIPSQDDPNAAPEYQDDGGQYPPAYDGSSYNAPSEMLRDASGLDAPGNYRKSLSGSTPAKRRFRVVIEDLGATDGTN